jgi:hypothetical protein
VAVQDDEETEAGTLIDQALTDSDTATKLADARRESRTLRLALGAKAKVEDQLSRVRLQLAEERARADVNQKRAEDAEVRIGKLRKALADATQAHAGEIERIRSEHERDLREAKQDARSTLAVAQKKYSEHIQKLMRDHAERMERLVSGRPHEPAAGPTMPEAVSTEPIPEPGRPWQDVVRDMKPAEDADPFHVRVYNTLTPLQQLTLAGLATGKPWRQSRTGSG